MPKRKIVNKKDAVLNELAAKLKSLPKKSAPIKLNFKKIKNLDELYEKDEEQEETDREEPDLTNLNLRNLEFTQFSDLLEGSGAPALERRALAVPRPIFVGGMPQTGTAASEETNGDKFKYVPGTADANEPKYIPTAESWGTPAERINMETLGRRQEFFPQANQKALFERASESKGFSSQNVETFGRVERFDIEKAGRRNPFERPEAKYEKYKPKLPKN